MIDKLVTFIICNPPVMKIVCFSVPVIAIIFTILGIKKVLER